MISIIQGRIHLAEMLDLSYVIHWPRTKILFGASFMISSPIINDIVMRQVVGFDFEKILEDQTYLFFRTFSLTVSYKFTNSSH